MELNQFSFFSLARTEQELRVSAQGVLQFIHNGLGRSCGTIFGGVLATNYGNEPMQSIFL